VWRLRVRFAEQTQFEAPVAASPERTNEPFDREYFASTVHRGDKTDRFRALDRGKFASTKHRGEKADHMRRVDGVCERQSSAKQTQFRLTVVALQQLFDGSRGDGLWRIISLRVYPMRGGMECQVIENKGTMLRDRDSGSQGFIGTFRRDAFTGQHMCCTLSGDERAVEAVASG
jgi:hypothetical protein